MIEGKTKFFSHHEIEEKVLMNYETLLEEIRSLKPHMYELSKSILKHAPVSFYAYLESIRKQYYDEQSYEAKYNSKHNKLKKYEPIMEEAEEEEDRYEISVTAPDKTASFLGYTILDTTQTNIDEIYTLNIFWKTTVIDLAQIQTPILAFLIRGIDLLKKYDIQLLYKLQEQFLQKNIQQILKNPLLEQGEELSLFREQPILPKRLLMDFVDRLEGGLTLDIVERFSVAINVLEIWMVALMEDGEGQQLEDEKLFQRMSLLFRFEFKKVQGKEGYQFTKEGEGFIITPVRHGYMLQLI